MQRNQRVGGDPFADGSSAPVQPQIVCMQPAKVIGARQADCKVGFGMPHVEIRPLEDAHADSAFVAPHDVER